MKVTVRPTSSGPGKWSNGTAKYVYSTVLISSALLAIPYYAIYYSLAPSRRPRPTWSLSEAMLIIFLHRSGRMTDQFLSHGMDAFSEIHAVEYRLLPSPSPAALQDAIAVYDHLTHVDKVAPEDLVLIGDSAGGNIALALATWLRDEGFAAPGGLLLLSPWCDPAAECPPTGPPTIRPNASSDYLCDSPRARAYLVSRFIGSHSVTSPYISPASHGTFGGFPRTPVNAAS
ncbi:hypothetical protein RQP46_008176 [Phenoliferia psychrophenolica]